MVPDDLTLAAGTRLLHIGPHKTGTTALQGAFHQARERLAAHGVVYAGASRSPVRATLAGQAASDAWARARPDMAYGTSWSGGLTGDQRVVISSEFFDEADDAVARRIVADLGGPRVHVVVTLRPLARIMPSQWQQYLQNGMRTPYLEWLDGILRKPLDGRPTPLFWQRHRHDKLIARWAAAAGVHNVTVIVVDGPDRLALLRTFESLLGLPAGRLVPADEVMNRSLTLAEAEVVRQLNEEFKRREWPGASYARFMRYGAVRQMKARGRCPASRRSPPGVGTGTGGEISAEMTGNIAALGVRVIGDLSALSSPAPPAGQPDAGAGDGPAAPLIPVEAAAQAILGAMLAGGIAGPAAGADKRAVADRPVREVDARRLAGVLVRRGRQRVRQALRPG
jgi:hypothetical protein